MKALAVVLAIAALAGGCAFERHILARPGENQAIKVDSGDQFIFDLEEEVISGCKWDCKCDDPDIEVRFDRNSIGLGDDGEGLCKVRVVMRIHRGYDGPSTAKFTYAKPSRRKNPEKEFTLTLYKNAGSAAFWK